TRTAGPPPRAVPRRRGGSTDTSPPSPRRPPVWGRRTGWRSRPRDGPRSSEAPLSVGKHRHGHLEGNVRGGRERLRLVEAAGDDLDAVRERDRRQAQEVDP